MKFDTIRSESAIIHAFPFNSEKKRGGVAVLRVISCPSHRHSMRKVSKVSYGADQDYILTHCRVILKFSFTGREQRR